MGDTETKLLSLLKGRFSSLSLSFNEHSSNYETIEQWEVSDGRANWASDDERLKAISRNTVWMLQWYPDTPVGSYTVAASSLEAIMNFVSDYDANAN